MGNLVVTNCAILRQFYVITRGKKRPYRLYSLSGRDPQCAILALGKSSGSIFPLYSFLVSIYKIVLGIHGSLVHDGI